MINLQPLSYSQHKHIKIITRHGSEFGEAVHTAPVQLNELENMCAQTPVCFMKNTETGQFGMYAILGFNEGENLFLNNDQWRLDYIPLQFRCQPFAPRPEQQPHATSAQCISINIHSKRISTTEGEALFNEDRTPTSYLSGIQNSLTDIARAAQPTRLFIETLVNNNLVEAATIAITFNNGDTFNYKGLYTINLDKLEEITHAARVEPLEQLHINPHHALLTQLEQQHYLAPITWLTQSLGNFQKLIALKNAKLNKAE